MKKNSNLLLGLLALGSSAMAQVLTAPMFNTGSQPPPYTTHRSYGLQDVVWTVAQTPDGSVNTPPATGYVKALVVNASGIGWFNPNPAPIANASWITYSNNCSVSLPAKHDCLSFPPPAGWGVDQWYQLQFYVCGNCNPCLNMDMWADNHVEDVWVNENTYGGPGHFINSVGAGPSSGTYKGYLRDSVINFSLCKNFKQGLNTIVVHVRSHGTTTGDLAGLLIRTNTVTPCDGIMYYTPDTNTLSVVTGTDNGGGGIDDGHPVDSVDWVPRRMMGGSGQSYDNGSMSGMSVVSLDQNIPNPFTESTSISYDIPEGTTKAQMVFANNEGLVVRRVDLKAGRGSITVVANDLNRGIYSYSIVVDGKTMASKKLIKE